MKVSRLCLGCMGFGDPTRWVHKWVLDEETAARYGVPRVHIALAWLLQKEPVTAPIIGATKLSHLEDAMGALAVKLTPDDVAYLEEPYVPHRIVGHQ